MTHPLRGLALLLVFALVTAGSAAQEALSGKLVSAGSDTLGSLSSLWAELLRRRYPAVIVQVRAIGSGAAPTALIQGTADLGPMSRPMSPAEESRFFQRYGYAPTPVPVAFDEIAVFVHRDNPIERVALTELDAMFSATRRCGHPRLIRDWQTLFPGENVPSRPISLYGRSAASGTYSVFRKQVLCGGDFSPHLHRLVGSSAVVRAVASDPNGVGYASAGYLNATVKRLAIDAPNSLTERLSRGLFLYINRAPGAPLEPLVAAYLDLVLSAAGQGEVSRAGYLALPADTLRSLRESLGLSRG